MTENEVELKVREIAARLLKKPVEAVRPESRWKEDLGADSLGVIELIYELEQAFKITIPDAKADGIRTVGDAVRYLKTAVRK